ncbi:MAG: DUF1150 family protein [Alphaproteobacteria bacterium]|nr:DUF1150 family protein [Alphaproteobacteria bacterium]
MQQLETSKLEDIMMAMVGLETMAYIKPVRDGLAMSYAVFAADGTRLALFDTEESAFYNAVKHNLAPVSIH